MSWSRLEGEAPRLAALGRARIDAARVVFLGTVRADGSPRISPVEPYFAVGRLLFGLMARSAKARDLAREARCAVHSVVSAPDAGEGELKLYGRAVEVHDEVRDAVADAWWRSYPADAALVVSFEIEEAEYVEWDLAGGSMRVHRWRPGAEVSEETRSYP